MIKIRFILALFVTLLAIGLSPATAQADPTIKWTGSNPYVFAVGDSIVQQCGEYYGMGWRSLGFIGWPGADSWAMKGRLEGSGTPAWPAWTVTESSVEEERTWFRDAGSLVIGLGTNDVKIMSVAQWSTMIDWFMEQSRGRPVEWFNIVNPPFQSTVDAFNAELRAAEQRWPNLKVLDWEKWVQQNPGQLHDGVHVSYPSGCTEGRDRLVQAGAPDIPGQDAPRGYWYWDSGKTGPVRLNGWGATNVENRQGPLWVNVRADFVHVGRWLVDRPTGDLWAQTASGRAFGIELDASFHGKLICADLVDAKGQFTSLGCRTV